MNHDELKTEVIHHPRPAGQYAGATRTGVKVTHIPTGLSAYCDSKWSQNQNKLVAMSMIEWGLAEIRG